MLEFGYGKLVALECNRTAKFHLIDKMKNTLTTKCGISKSRNEFTRSGFGWNLIRESFDPEITCKKCYKS